MCKISLLFCWKMENDKQNWNWIEKYGDVPRKMHRNGSEWFDRRIISEMDYFFIHSFHRASYHEFVHVRAGWVHLERWSQLLRHYYCCNGIRSWRLFLLFRTETFTLHLIQYSIKPPPNILHMSSNKRFGPYMIYALLLLSIQSDSIESATVSAQIPDVHHNYWGGKCCLSAVFRHRNHLNEGASTDSQCHIWMQFFFFRHKVDSIKTACELRMMTMMMMMIFVGDVACKWGRKINISPP